MGRGAVRQGVMSRNTPKKPTKPASAAELRERRLAEALRNNLKRRKAAERAAGSTSGEPDPEDDKTAG
jgi:hypothetical protein